MLQVPCGLHHFLPPFFFARYVVCGNAEGEGKARHEWLSSDFIFNSGPKFAHFRQQSFLLNILGLLGIKQYFLGSAEVSRLRYMQTCMILVCVHRVCMALSWTKWRSRTHEVLARSETTPYDMAGFCSRNLLRTWRLDFLFFAVFTLIHWILFI